MEIRYKDLEDNGFAFDPDESILAEYLACVMVSLQER